MPETGQLSPLTCTRCKSRKVRCTRAIPACERCESRNLECIYPVRVKRKSARSGQGAEKASVSDSELSIILNRLQKLERQCQSVASAQPTPTGSGADISSAVVSPSTPSISQLNLDPDLRQRYSPSIPNVEFDATVILKEAVAQVQKLRLRNLSTSVITDEVIIPSEHARQFISNYFTHLPCSTFLSLVNKRLILLIPDIIGLPHVHLDAAILVVYYCILYQGCNLKASNTNSNRQGSQYSKSIYLACLRAIPGWQREATGTTTDFIAATYMTWVATEFFDYDLAWRMFKLAGEYCQVLNLHNLDEHAESTNSDDDRRGFWELIHIDLFFRLIFQRPPTITANPWKVNLPWLDASSQPLPDGVTSTAFLASSRISLVLMRYFSLLESCETLSETEVTSSTEALCEEIKEILAEWKLEEWLTGSSGNEEDTWAVLDVLITGYTSIIFMCRKPGALESNVPEPLDSTRGIPNSRTVINAARSAICLLTQVIDMHPSIETASALFGAYKGFVPYGCLANKILSDADIWNHEADFKLLERMADQVAHLSRGEQELIPLVRAMQFLNTQIDERKLRERSMTGIEG